MKKRILALLLVVALAATALIGGTLSYLTAKTESITNTFELGEIKYSLTLHANKPDTATTDVDMPEVSPDSPATAAAGSVEFTLDQDPGLMGYEFLGWYTEAEDGVKVHDVGTTSIEVGYNEPYTETNGDTVSLTLYAHWEPIKYKVVYDANGDDVTGTTEESLHEYDVEKPLTKNGYERTGYVFTGWNTMPDGSGTDYEDGAVVKNLTSEKDAVVTLYAQWKQMDFIVSFDTQKNDVTNPADQTVTYGESYGELPVVTHPEYNFIGWTFTPDGTDYVTKDTIVNIEENHTLYGQWTEKSKYTITYYANASDASFTDGAKQITELKIHDTDYVIKTPTELEVNRGDSWIWTEWNTKPDGTGETYLGGRNYTANENLVLYAIWNTKTAVTFGDAKFVNMGDPSQVDGSDSYNFTIKCKTQGGADGIAIPMYNLQPGYLYRLTFSVTFNDFKFYEEDSHGYIFGTNIIENYLNYHSQSSILSQKDTTVTHKYENMQWSTESSGHYEISLDFVPSQETMYWFWETTDIVDHNEMNYEFNNFNIQMLKSDGPYGPRVAFEDLTVEFAAAPYVNAVSGNNTLTAAGAPINTATNSYGTRWIDYKDASGNELTARHKNYFHTENYGLDNLTYRVWGYAGHEVMTIPITGLEIGKTYTLTFTQDLSNAIVYNTDGSALNTNQLYGCAVTATKDMDANYDTTNSVNKQTGYQDLRRAKVGAVSNQSITFTASAETMYWQWLLGDLKDGGSAGWRYSVVKLYNVKLS